MVIINNEIVVDNDGILFEQEERIISETVFIRNGIACSDEVIQSIGNCIAKIGMILILLYVYYYFIK